MLRFKHSFIKVFVAFTLCFSFTSMGVAQETTETANVSQTKAPEIKYTINKKVKESQRWKDKKLKETQSVIKRANNSIESFQKRAMPLRERIQKKIPRGAKTSEREFRDMLKNSNAPAIFIVFAFIFAVWILGYASARD